MSLVVVLSAVVMAGAVGRREILSRSSDESRSGALTYEADWREMSAYGVVMGDSTAPIQVVEFSDLECPACRAFHETLDQVSGAYGSRVSATFIHFPLRRHRFATPAARAAECAAQEGRFSAFIDVIFENQDSLGLKSWGSYAVAAGIRDTASFRRCTMTTGFFARIDSGVALGRRIELRGTPTVFVNGWRFPSPPSPQVLSQVIDELLLGRTPEKVYLQAIGQ